jgi:hypothetical protein
MPRMDKESRAYLCGAVMTLRDAQYRTFDEIARELRLPSRQAARLLYRQGMQMNNDADAMDFCRAGIQIPAHLEVSKRVERQLRRSHPEAWVTRDALNANSMIRTRGDGSEQEPW